MSFTNKAAELAALKELRSDLQAAEKTKNHISQLQTWIRNTPSQPLKETYGHQLRTDHAAEERLKYITQNQQKKSRITVTFLIIAVALFLAMAGCWLFFSGIFEKDTYLHTPEVVGEYSGVYYTVQDKECRANLVITSCDEDGTLDGYFEFYHKDFFDTETYGKYNISGSILTKSREGYITASIAYTKWVEQPTGFHPLSDMQITIYDHFQAIRSESYDLCLYAKDREDRTCVDDLYTPEIIKTYTGEFTPNTGKVGTASITIESCNEAGQVRGLFEYTYEGQGSAKWALTGQITKKYSDGSLELTLKPGEAIHNSYMFYYPPSSFDVEIYDQYRSFFSREGMRWFYQDEGFEEDPDPVFTPTQILAQKAKPILFKVYPLVVLVLAVLLFLKRTDSFTPAQKKKLAELTQLDLRYKEENKHQNDQRRAQEAQQRKKDMAYWKQSLASNEEALENYRRKIQRSTILAEADKTLSNVEFLIQKLESGRADSLKEALNLMDEYHRRTSETLLRMETARLEARQRAQFEADQAMHNLNMEYEARRKNDELEKIRRALED